MPHCPKRSTHSKLHFDRSDAERNAALEPVVKPPLGDYDPCSGETRRQENSMWEVGLKCDECEQTHVVCADLELASDALDADGTSVEE